MEVVNMPCVQALTELYEMILSAAAAAAAVLLSS